MQGAVGPLDPTHEQRCIEQLAGGVAHDFNNLLAVITATSGYILQQLGPDHPLAASLAEIDAAAQRGKQLTRQLLAYSRKQRLTRSLLSLNAVVRGAEPLVRRTLGERIALAIDLRTDLGAVQADGELLEQVLMHLVDNARDAMSNGGALAIATAPVDLAAADAAALGLVAGRYCTLAVRDDGCGMDAATRARIFEPFFTTKEVGAGTGLGLATVIGLVRQHDGGIAVQTTPGQGSTFRIYLPQVSARPIDEEPTRPLRRPPPRGSESVLVVDDDAMVRTALVRQLRALGYRIVEAPTPAVALELLGREDAPFDLLLTDIVMPGLDGRALARQALAMRPRLRVLFMSGCTDHAGVANDPLRPDEHFLAKPFSQLELADTLRRALA